MHVCVVFYRITEIMLIKHKLCASLGLITYYL